MAKGLPVGSVWKGGRDGRRSGGQGLDVGQTEPFSAGEGLSLSGYLSDCRRHNASRLSCAHGPQARATMWEKHQKEKTLQSLPVSFPCTSPNNCGTHRTKRSVARPSALSCTAFARVWQCRTRLFVSFRLTQHAERSGTTLEPSSKPAACTGVASKWSEGILSVCIHRSNEYLMGTPEGVVKSLYRNSTESGVHGRRDELAEYGFHSRWGRLRGT